MFTSYDKFWAAVLMCALYALKNWFGIDLGLSEAAVAQIALGITALIVVLTPNKQKA